MRIAAAAFVFATACSSSPTPAPKSTDTEPKEEASDETTALAVKAEAELKRGGLEALASAASLFGQACEAGNGKACTSLGYLVRDGITGEKMAAATPWFRKGCDAGDAAGCGAAGGLLFEAGDSEGGLALLQKSCASDNGRSCQILGGLLADSDAEAAKVASTKAQDLLLAGCRTEGRFCGHLADSYQRGLGVDQDLARSFELYQLGCKRGDAHSCFVAAKYHGIGLGGAETSEQKSLDLLTKACELANGEGCTYRGLVLFNRGDKSTAFEMFERGCALASGRGCDLLASHAPGLSAENKHGRYKLACQYRHPRGCFNAGVSVLKTDATAKADALELFDRGCVELRNICSDALCSEGIRDSCHNAGTLHAETDEAKAQERFKAACALKNEASCAYVK